MRPEYPCHTVCVWGQRRWSGRNFRCGLWYLMCVYCPTTHCGCWDFVVDIKNISLPSLPPYSVLILKLSHFWQIITTPPSTLYQVREPGIVVGMIFPVDFVLNTCTCGFIDCRNYHLVRNFQGPNFHNLALQLDIIFTTWLCNWIFTKINFANCTTFTLSFMGP